VNVETSLLRPVYLHPAQVCWCDTPTRVETVLGSCVAVTMWDPRSHFGCICHAVLPRESGTGTEPWKYVDASIHLMLEEMDARSIHWADIEVKLFGGASMREMRPGRASVGFQNVEAAVLALKAAGLLPRTSDTGGSAGRKLRFYSGTGDVFVRRIRLENTEP
jgi:chemotaxis protein CheD